MPDWSVVMNFPRVFLMEPFHCWLALRVPLTPDLKRWNKLSWSNVTCRVHVNFVCSSMHDCYADIKYHHPPIFLRCASWDQISHQECFRCSVVCLSGPVFDICRRRPTEQLYWWSAGLPKRVCLLRWWAACNRHIDVWWDSSLHVTFCRFLVSAGWSSKVFQCNGSWVLPMALPCALTVQNYDPVGVKTPANSYVCEHLLKSCRHKEPIVVLLKNDSSDKELLIFLAHSPSQNIGISIAVIPQACNCHFKLTVVST